jgi:hypothetical protein
VVKIKRYDRKPRLEGEKGTITKFDQVTGMATVDLDDQLISVH